MAAPPCGAFAPIASISRLPALSTGVRDVRAGLLVEAGRQAALRTPRASCVARRSVQSLHTALGGGVSANCKRLWFLRRRRYALHVSFRCCYRTHCSLQERSLGSRAGLLTGSNCLSSCVAQGFKGVWGTQPGPNSRLEENTREL